MRRLLSSAAALLALVAVVGVMPEAAEAKTTKVQCGATITVDTVLKADVSCNDWQYISVVAGATLDLNGHTITNTDPGFCGSGLLYSPSGPNGSGCAVSVRGTLRNGQVDGGVFIGASVVGSTYVQGLVEAVSVTGPSAIASGILRSSVLRGSVRGIQSVTVERSALVGAGIHVDNIDWGLSLAVRDSWIIDSPGDAIDIEIGFFPGEDDVGVEITGNMIVGAGGAGIAAGGSADYRPSVLSRNIVWNSKGDGILWPGESVSPADPAWFSGPMSVDHNLVMSNGGHGIVIQGRIKQGDKSGNVALFNKGKPQCVYVRCSDDLFGS